MCAMALNSDQNCYMDTGATNHMSYNTSNISSYVNNSCLKHIVVGSEFQISISTMGKTTLKPPCPQLHLSNILGATHFIKILFYVNRLTTDNPIVINFDQSGFLVKDFRPRFMSSYVTTLGIYTH